MSKRRTIRAPLPLLAQTRDASPSRLPRGESVCRTAQAQRNAKRAERQDRPSWFPSKPAARGPPRPAEVPPRLPRSTDHSGVTRADVSESSRSLTVRRHSGCAGRKWPYGPSAWPVIWTKPNAPFSKGIRTHPQIRYGPFEPDRVKCETRPECPRAGPAKTQRSNRFRRPPSTRSRSGVAPALCTFSSHTYADNVPPPAW